MKPQPGPDSAVSRVVFLDVGGVIVDETNLEEAKAALLTGLIALRTSYSLDQYWRDTAEAVFRFVPSTYDYVLYKNCGPQGFGPAKAEFQRLWKAEDRPLQPTKGLGEWVRRVSKTHRLGILGQYGGEVVRLLERESLLDCFAYADTQDKFGLTKPDPRYFEAVVHRAGQRPEDGIMVGDRIDKDVIPAKMVGMKTVRLRTGIHRLQEPRTPWEIPDLTVESLDEITEQALDRL